MIDVIMNKSQSISMTGLGQWVSQTNQLWTFDECTVGRFQIAITLDAYSKKGCFQLQLRNTEGMFEKAKRQLGEQPKIVRILGTPFTLGSDYNWLCNNILPINKYRDGWKSKAISLDLHNYSSYIFAIGIKSQHSVTELKRRSSGADRMQRWHIGKGQEWNDLT